MGVFLSVIEDGELAASFESLPDKVGREIGLSALREGGEPMAAAIRAHINDRTGLLSRNLKIRAARSDRPGRVAVLISSTTSREKFAAAQSSGVAGRVRRLGLGSDRYRVYYDIPVEFGHRTGEYIAGGRLNGSRLRRVDLSARVEAHPFMRPGFAETIEAVLDAGEEKIGEGLDAIMQK